MRTEARANGVPRDELRALRRLRDCALLPRLVRSGCREQRWASAGARRGAPVSSPGAQVDGSLTAGQPPPARIVKGVEMAREGSLELLVLTGTTKDTNAVLHLTC
jgi:hypothetical protein